MKRMIEEVRNGFSPGEWILKNRVGRPVFNPSRRKEAEHPIMAVRTSSAP